jgi:hypothetical protein
VRGAPLIDSMERRPPLARRPLTPGPSPARGEGRKLAARPLPLAYANGKRSAAPRGDNLARWKIALTWPLPSEWERDEKTAPRGANWLRGDAAHRIQASACAPAGVAGSDSRLARGSAGDLSPKGAPVRFTDLQRKELRPLRFSIALKNCSVAKPPPIPKHCRRVSSTLAPPGNDGQRSPINSSPTSQWIRMTSARR